MVMEASMNPIRFATIVAALVVAMLACGLPDNILNGGGDDSDMQAVAELWSDVPPMDEMTTAQQIEMPAALKALARPIMDAMMQGLNDGQDAGHWDWITFSLSATTPADVQAFYTPERMSPFGWDQAEAACLPLSDQGVLCSFVKDEADKTTGLIVLAATDEQQQTTSVFFLRAEGVPGIPAPELTPSSVPLSLTPIAAITLGQDLTTIDLCQAIPTEDIEAVLGRKLAQAPERFDFYETPGASGCIYAAETGASGEAHYGYVVLTPVEVYAEQPLYLNVEVTGLGSEAYFNNGGDTRQLWVKIDDRVAFVVAFGDIANEDYEKAIAKLLVAAIK
jgi:hypothetical protein